MGAGPDGASVNEGSPLRIQGSNDNLNMNFAENAVYNFLLDATLTETPELTVTKQ
jgi:pullulanase